MMEVEEKDFGSLKKIMTLNSPFFSNASYKSVKSQKETHLQVVFFMIVFLVFASLIFVFYKKYKLLK